jgi:hypothetical protein
LGRQGKGPRKEDPKHMIPLRRVTHSSTMYNLVVSTPSEKHMRVVGVGHEHKIIPKKHKKYNMV